MMVNMFSEYVRVNGMSESAVTKEFDTAKRHVLKILKAYAYGEMKEEIERRNPAPKEVRKPLAKIDEPKRDSGPAPSGVNQGAVRS